MKKTALAQMLISALLFSALANSGLKTTEANPFHSPVWEGVSPLAYPEIAILTPTENNTLLNSDNLTLTFNANIESGKANVRTEGGIFPTIETVDFTAYMGQVYYKTSWQQDNITVTLIDDSDPLNIFYTINLIDIPEGNQTLTITAVGYGYYPGYKSVIPNYPEDPTSIPVCYNFESVSNYTLGFAVDTTSPQVSILELNNKIFSDAEVPLSFTVSELPSRIVYSLDGRENVTLTENTTLSGLPEGKHSLAVYASDEAGNTGFETVYFSVTLFPITLVVASAIAVAAAVVSVGLLVYFKKRKH